MSRVIEGNGADPDTFEQIDLIEADIFAALTDDTKVNLTACEMVHERVPDIQTILRISQDGEQDYGHRYFVE